ncbi:ExbD/TolR family protein [Desulforhopalus singaporensis]|uniref:Outer membrane transport energization protein ExbD (TC 2.C.1.1.1) n=1 Tax=Desulforhopalus singaporensis TaxID=91360 RepID=A0A1H0SIH4_9BACT|nr:biopolymer transporter ExbD [Desulforhopalus singaporensis]SDP41517.1 outer membrane transport energization protein ExbD (TC 2.C.1.1.1) [Desulforhopalus singaporensis]
MLNITAARKAARSTPMLDIAPLIDMVFILLIFFLVNTSYVKETGIDVNRPTASSASAKNQTAILIAIDHENRVFMERREIDLRAVRANVARALAEAPESQVVVVADRASSTGIAIRVMDSCRMAGADNVSLAANLPQES